MKRYLVLYGLSIAALFTALTAHAQDNITATKNEDGTWTFVKPADMNVELEVVYYTQEELDSIAQPVKLNSEPLPIADNDTEADDNEEKAEENAVTQDPEKTLSAKDTKVKKETAKKKRNRHKRSRRRARRR